MKTPKKSLAAVLIVSLLTLSCSAPEEPDHATLHVATTPVAESVPPAPAAVSSEPAAGPLWAEPFPADPAPAAPEAVQPASSRDFRAETAKYIGYFKSIYLTPEQEAIKNAALTKIPAPCCSENSIATCCCPCNMAKAVWGLSAYLITEEGYDAQRLEKAVRDWLAAANPNGFSGRACYTGGCARSIEHDGCAGMVEEAVL